MKWLAMCLVLTACSGAVNDPSKAPPPVVPPAAISNVVTITPSATQGGGCAPAICSGGDAEIVATLSQGGQALAGRAVRFEVVSGDFRFITSAPGQAESTDIVAAVTTDSSGKARARVRITPNAQNQTAILRVVDIAGGFQTSSFTIAQATGTSPGFFAIPDTVTFSGATTDTCASSGSADITIFGGAPPYTVSSAGAPFAISRQAVSASGGSFSVFPAGMCADAALISITDSSGRNVFVRISNIRGTNAVPDIALQPTTVTLNECTSVASVSITGGNGFYVVNSGNSSIYARMAGQNTIVIGRQPDTLSPASVNVGVTSGNKAAFVVVNVEGAALSSRCP